MQVEVNAHNIILYNLVGLTGNSAESMLHAARLAELEGDVLTCEVPDDAIKRANTFDLFNSTEADPTLGHEDSPLQQGVDEFAERLRERFQEAFPASRLYNPHIVVDGELVDVSDDPMSTSHIPFPPDMTPFEDEEE